MFEFTVENYWEMWDKASKDEISSDEWSLYCNMYLAKLMRNYKDVLQELEKKERYIK